MNIHNHRVNKLCSARAYVYEYAHAHTLMGERTNRRFCKASARINIKDLREEREPSNGHFENFSYVYIVVRTSDNYTAFVTPFFFSPGVSGKISISNAGANAYILYARFLVSAHETFTFLSWEWPFWGISKSGIT